MKKKLLKNVISLLLMIAPFCSSGQVLFSESFSSGSLPAGWTNDSLGFVPQNLWVFNNPYTRVITGAGFDANFAIFDSDEGSSDDGIPELASLTTPNFSISAAVDTLVLEFDEQYRPLLGPGQGGSSRRIEYSTDLGVNWTTLIYDSIGVGYPNPAVHSSYDMTSLLGQANLEIRFTWTGTWDWWWAIDNVSVLTGTSVGLSKIEARGISVFPSPTSGLVNINFGDLSSGKASVKVVDPAGNVFRNEIMDCSLAGSVDLTALANGIYFLKIENENGVFTKKIILRR